MGPQRMPSTKPVFVLTRDLIDAMHTLCVAEDAVLALSREMGDQAPMEIKHQADRIRAGRIHGHATYREFQQAHLLRPVIHRPVAEPPAAQPTRRRFWSRQR